MARIVELNRGPLLGEAPRARIVALPAADAQVLDVRDGAQLRRGPHGRVVQRLRRGVRLRQPLRLRARSRARGRDRGRRRTSRPRTPRASSRRSASRSSPRSASASTRRTAHARFEPIGLGEMGALADQAASCRSWTCARPPSRPSWPPARSPCPTACWPRPTSRRSIPRRPTAVVCHTGTRSPLAASLLARRGFTHVRPVLGEGMGAWGARDQEAAEAELAKAARLAKAQGAAEGRDRAVRSPETAAEPVEPLSG